MIQSPRIPDGLKMEKKPNMEKGFPDLRRWSPPRPLFGEKTESGERISWISVVGVPLVWRLKRPNAYQPGQRSHYHTVIRKSFLETFTSRFHKIEGLIQHMKFVFFLKILSVWRNGLQRKWWRIDTWKAHWPSLRPNGDRCSFSSPSYADPSTHVVINNHQESSYLRYIPLHHRHRIARSDLDKKCWTRFKPISLDEKAFEKARTKIWSQNCSDRNTIILPIPAFHGPLAEYLYPSMFIVCSFVRPAMVTSPLLHAPDPQTHTFSDRY